VIANRILDLIITILAWIVVPVQFVTTLVLGILVTITFGFLLLPLSLVWVVLIFPMIGVSWLCKGSEVLRNTIGLIGIPWALVAHTYACLVPSMGEIESRADKLMLAEAWPFCWEYWRFGNGRLDFKSPEGQVFYRVLLRISRRDAVKQRTISRLIMREQLDPNI
jgi:hypothetical protein